MTRSGLINLFQQVLGVPEKQAEKDRRVFPERQTGHHLQEKKYGEFVD